ncbi:DUF3043 domain-containing protein [Amnibacterium sp.]|uniref:DUF3043 domain-containing protein n=1 Tax=Amnibacterium sp. TaxID=1872496 RepID=UPI0026293740|nr:DUF3043 domain-containing protein [Amnibacterium sp.]MCU1475265.1 hypothetical protein [Amnibacterium sp.]
MAKKAPAEPVVPVPQGSGKGRATPSRREAEQARRRPLVPTDRKQAQRTSRTAAAAERERVRVGMARGEERYLPARDKGPQRRFVRDAVDARWTIGEFLIPIFIVFFIGTFVTPVGIQVYLEFVLYGVLALTILDALLVAWSVRRKLAARLGGKDKVDRGLNLYTVMRAAQFRSLRTPKPQVKRGDRIEYRG